MFHVLVENYGNPFIHLRSCVLHFCVIISFFFPPYLFYWHYFPADSAKNMQFPLLLSRLPFVTLSNKFTHARVHDLLAALCLVLRHINLPLMLSLPNFLSAMLLVTGACTANCVLCTKTELRL